METKKKSWMQALFAYAEGEKRRLILSVVLSVLRSRLKQGDLRPRRSPCFLFRLTPISPPLIMVDT